MKKKSLLALRKEVKEKQYHPVPRDDIQNSRLRAKGRKAAISDDSNQMTLETAFSPSHVYFFPRRPCRKSD